MPPHFIEAGLKINTAEYLTILKDVLMPWTVRYRRKKVQDFLKENLPLMFSKDIWPSNSPDVNICDYWLFGCDYWRPT